MDEGSPLAGHTRRLAAAIGERLPGVPVAHALRYGGPGIAAAIDELRSRGCARVLVPPLYPQYSTATTASVADVLEAIDREDRKRTRLELQSLVRISYAVFCLKKKKTNQ